jgi:hypothetical protein
MKMSTVVFWVVTQCCLVGGYQSFEGTYRLHLQCSILKMGRYVPLKLWQPQTKLHDVITQKTTIDIIMYVNVQISLLNYISVLGIINSFLCYVNIVLRCLLTAYREKDAITNNMHTLIKLILFVLVLPSGLQPSQYFHFCFVFLTCRTPRPTIRLKTASVPKKNQCNILYKP